MSFPESQSRQGVTSRNPFTKDANWGHLADQDTGRPLYITYDQLWWSGFWYGVIASGAFAIVIFAAVLGLAAFTAR